MMTALFWICLSLLAYTHVGYPLLVAVVARWRAVPARPAPSATTAALVICARNEAAVLPAKLLRLLEGPDASRIAQILVADDGSTDGTADAVRALGDSRIQVEAFETPRGKPARLNALVPKAACDLVVFNDARQDLAPGALGALLDTFADPSVGVMSGELVFRDGETAGAAGQGMGAYWAYEKWIRKNESRAASVPGATGAFYAIRRDRFRPLPEDTLLDDVWIPMEIIAQGMRCGFLPGALAFDTPSASLGRESIRKRRTLAGNIQLMLRRPVWMLPGGHPIWWAFLSHKILRLFSPFLHLLLFVAAWLARDAHPACLLVLALHVPAGLLAAVGGMLPAGRGGVWGRLARVAGMYAALQGMTLLAWGDALRGRFNPAWQASAGARP